MSAARPGPRASGRIAERFLGERPAAIGIRWAGRAAGGGNLASRCVPQPGARGRGCRMPPPLGLRLVDDGVRPFLVGGRGAGNRRTNGYPQNRRPSNRIKRQPRRDALGAFGADALFLWRLPAVEMRCPWQKLARWSSARNRRPEKSPLFVVPRAANQNEGSNPSRMGVGVFPSRSGIC